MHDTDTFMFFKYIFKMWVAVYLVTHTFDIAMAVFDVANHVVTGAGGIISGSASIDVADALKTILENGVGDMGIGELLGLGLETMIVSLCMKIISVLITVILYGRMIEIYRASRSAGFSKPVKKSIKDVKSVTLASSDLPRRETTRGTIAYRKNRKLGKPSTHD